MTKWQSCTYETIEPTSAAVWSLVSSLGRPLALVDFSSPPSSSPTSVTTVTLDGFALFRGPSSACTGWAFFTLPPFPARWMPAVPTNCSASRMARLEDIGRLWSLISGNFGVFRGRRLVGIAGRRLDDVYAWELWLMRLKPSWGRLGDTGLGGTGAGGAAELTKGCGAVCFTRWSRLRSDARI